MKIPTVDPLRVAPQAVLAPARRASAVDISGLRQGAAEAGEALGQAAKTFDKLKDQFAVKEALDLNTQLHRGVTDEMYGGGEAAPTVMGNTGADAAAAGAPSQAALAAAGTNDKTVSLDFSDTTLAGQVPQRTPGFLSTRGDASLKELDASQARIADLRQKLMEKASSPRAKELFKKASDELLTSTYQQAHSHVAQQLEVSKTDAVKASLAETLRSAAEDPGNDERNNLLVAHTAAAAAELATNEADAENKINAVRAEAASTRAKALIDTKDYDAAERVVKESRHALGEKAPALDATIKHERLQSDANVAAQAAVGASLGEDKRVDVTTLEDELAKMPPELQKAARTTAYEVAAHRNAAQDKNDQQTVKQIWGVKNKVGWGATPKALKEQLNKIDPRLFDSFEDEAYRRWKVSQGSKSEQAKAQAEYDRNALMDYQLSGENAQERVKQPVDDFLMRYPGLSEHGKKAIELKRQGDTGIVDKGLATSEQQFMRDVKSNGQGLVKGKSAQKEYEAEAGIAFEEQIRENNGKPVTREQALRIIGQLTEKHIKKGIIFDSEELGYQQRRRQREETKKAGFDPTLQAPPPPADAGKPTYNERVRQLKAAGKTKDDARQILQHEGY